MRSSTKLIAVAMLAACLIFLARTQAEENLPDTQIDNIQIGNQEMGDVIFHMLAAHEITGDKKFLDRANYDQLFPDGWLRPPESILEARPLRGHHTGRHDDDGPAQAMASSEHA
jgi:hypothetical protein